MKPRRTYSPHARNARSHDYAQASGTGASHKITQANGARLRGRGHVHLSHEVRAVLTLGALPPRDLVRDVQVNVDVDGASLDVPTPATAS
jgi:hypothetical protein